MEELVRFMAKSLVDHPDLVDVRTVEEPASTVIELRVGPDDMGKVIGKQGRIAGDETHQERQICKSSVCCCGIRRKPEAGMDLDIKWKARDEDAVSAHW